MKKMKTKRRRTTETVASIKIAVKGPRRCEKVPGDAVSDRLVDDRRLEAAIGGVRKRLRQLVPAAGATDSLVVVPTRGPGNLLVLLHPLAHRQQENFTTESLAHLLEYLLDREPGAAGRVLDWLTNSSFFSLRNAGETPSIRTQAYAAEHGIPDIRIESDEIDVIIEVKLDDGLTFEQANAYATLLAKGGRRRQTLVALTGATPVERLPKGTVVRNWGDLGVMLRKETCESSSDLTHHLVNQFVGLLNHLNLMPRQVRSPLSKELQEHRRWADATPKEPSIFRGRIRSIETLSGMPHTEQLRNLLLQMERVLAKASGVKRYKLDSGPKMADDPWIGFNVNDLTYFFYLPLNEPDRISLGRYPHDVDPRSFDGSFGSLGRSTPNGLAQWDAELDLLESGVAFFGADEVEQERTLAVFFERAFAFGERLPTRKPRTA
jgi:hypothetical protein